MTSTPNSREDQMTDDTDQPQGFLIGDMAYPVEDSPPEQELTPRAQNILSRDYEQAIEQSLQVRRLVLRIIDNGWSAELDPTEHAVVRFIADRTIGFKKVYERVTVRQICNGIMTRDGRWVHRGIKISESTAKRTINRLLEGRYIERVLLRAPNVHSKHYMYAICMTTEEILAYTRPDSELCLYDR